jgi:hypothetical protein
VKRLTAIFLLALVPLTASANHDRHLNHGDAPETDRSAINETVALAAGGLGLVLLGWAWRRQTRNKDSRD